MDTPTTPNIIPQRQAVLFDILVEHSPPGTAPLERDDVESVLRVQCWIKKIGARTPDEAGRKAQTFLEVTKNVTNIQVIRWRFFSSAREKGVNNDGTLFA